MSGRIRTIKPELLEDAVTAGLSDTAFRLFIGCILLADDYGRLRFEPAWVRVQVLWKRPVSDEVFDEAFAELAALIVGYEVKGQAYGAIRNWEKHQKVSHKGKPRIPPPPEILAKPSGDSPEILRPDLRPGNIDQGPPTRDHAPPRPDDDGSGFATGTASAIEAKATFELAVAEATGAKFGLPRAPFHMADLCDVLNTFATGETKTAKLAWLRETVADWVHAADGKSTAGWQPSKLQNWLNGNRPSSRQPIAARGAEITKQPYDPNAPWMKVGA